MVSEIGENFSDELKEAGLFGLPFSWGDDGTFTFDPSMDQKDIDKVKAVYAAHVPNEVL
jgi:hypothetical protein